MEALRDIGKLFLVLVCIAVWLYLAYKFWWMTLFLTGAAVVLLIIKYVVNGRFRGGGK